MREQITDLELGRELFVHEIIAKNYGADHANRIHSDKGAAKYGFSSALVPGVGLYAYLTRPAVEALGRRWLECGVMNAKFIHPVSDREKMRVQGRVMTIDPVELRLELINSSDQLCAVGSAGLPIVPPELDPRDYPFRPLPVSDQLLPATIAALSAGDAIGSLEFTVDFAGEITRFLDNVVEAMPIYRGADAVCHPAYLVAQANEILMRNVALGPWIHTATETQHLSLAQNGERLSLRGRISETYERRGHEFVVLDLGMFGDRGRPVARLRHTAIIKLREADA